MNYKYLLDNVFIDAIRNIQLILDRQQKKRGLFILSLLVFNVVIDVLGLAILYPLIDAIVNPDLIHQKFYASYFYDFFGLADTISFLMVLSWIVLVVLVLKNITNLAIVHVQMKYAFGIALNLNQRMLQYNYQKGYLFLKNQTSGQKLHNVKYSPEYFAEHYFMSVLLALTEILVIGFICIGLISYQPYILALLLIIVLPLFYGIYKFIENKIEEKGRKINETAIKSYSIVLEVVNAFIDVVLTNKEKKIAEEFLTTQSELFDAKVSLKIFSSVPRKMFDISLIIGIIIILTVNWLIGENATNIISTLSIFALAAYRLIPAISTVVSLFVNLKNLNPTIQPILKLGKFPSHPFEEVQALPINQSITFKQVSFTFPDAKETTILRDITFSVKKGEKIGIIGVSGSGKTTLLKILLRLLKEDTGCIEIDGRLLDSSMDACFQKNIGFVQQKIFIKNGSLKSNIAFGEEEEEIRLAHLNQAIEQAMLSDFVQSHPQGLEMELGEKGVKLSGGQQQRVGIARALYKRAQILVFDEPTSALDMETESVIVDTIKHLAETDKTIFIVAHRITTLSSCDRIYELENGQIRSCLSYQELCKEKLLLAS